MVLDGLLVSEARQVMVGRLELAMAQEQLELLDVGAVLQGHLGEGRRRAAGEAPLGCQLGCKTHRFGRFSGPASRFRIYGLEGRVGFEPTTPGLKGTDWGLIATAPDSKTGVKSGWNRALGGAANRDNW